MSSHGLITDNYALVQERKTPIFSLKLSQKLENGTNEMPGTFLCAEH